MTRLLLLLGGVADALTEAISALEEDTSLEAARATGACKTALDSLKKEMKEELTEDTFSQTQTTFTELD